MASRKMTFTIPEDVADRFIRQIPAHDRSSYVAEAIAALLKAREQSLIRACEIANGDADVAQIEREWESLADEADVVAEPWNHADPR
jgi:hypothetical protein